MKITAKEKDNDCCICAYASCEGVTWKVAKRRLRKHLTSRKKLGVNSKSIAIKGVKGYDVIKSGSAETLNELFKFRVGMIFISFGNGRGHALAWDGVRLIDHETLGRFNGEKDLSKLGDGESINMILIKNRFSIITYAFSYFSHLLKKFKLN